MLWVLWGSWLTAIGHTLITGSSFKNFVLCDTCSAQPSNNLPRLPLMAWLMSGGSCKECNKPLSSLYILVPLFSALAFGALNYYVPPEFISAYIYFFSTLIITIYTDLRYMLISRFATVYILPIPLLFSYFGMIPIMPYQVMLGALSGYVVLASISKLYERIMHKQGMGQGDTDLLCYIGAFLGFGGWWISLLIGSCIGSIVGIVYLFASGKDKQAKIPFGPFLALGAMIYTIWGEWLFQLLFPGI